MLQTQTLKSLHDKILGDVVTLVIFSMKDFDDGYGQGQWIDSTVKRQIRKIEVLICTWGNSLLLFQAFLLNRVTWSSNKCKLGRWYVMIHCVRTFWENCARTLFIHSQIANIPPPYVLLELWYCCHLLFSLFSISRLLCYICHVASCWLYYC